MRKYIILLVLLLAAASFVRLYRISDYMHFLGDEGRDVLVVKRMIIDGEFTLLGPITSVGSMYLGPIYYYFMIPFLYIFKMDPVGPAVMIALLSLATVALIYILGIEFFNLKVAIIASLLYAFSPLVIVHSRFSWNPNAVPFFALFLIYSLTKLVVKKQKNWAFPCGLSLGVLFQLHYLALMFIPIILVVLLLFKEFKLQNIGKIILGTLVMLSPFLAFEFRHNFPNTQTVLRFITKTGSGATFAFGKFYLIVSDLTLRTFWRILIIESATLSKVFILFIIVSLFLILREKKKNSFNQALIILVVWYTISLICFGLYQGAIYDYYLVNIFPLPSLLAAVTFSWYMDKKGINKIIMLIIFFSILFFQLKNSPLLKEPNRLLYLTKARARFILEKAGSDPYNFALITGSNSDHAYRYFLELWGKPPLTIQNPQLDPERKSVTESLYVICEISDCSPLGHPLWEIAGFGRAEIENSWEVEGVKIFKLTHYKEE